MDTVADLRADAKFKFIEMRWDRWWLRAGRPPVRAAGLAIPALSAAHTRPIRWRT
jgi:hypothetical protein